MIIIIFHHENHLFVFRSSNNKIKSNAGGGEVESDELIIRFRTVNNKFRFEKTIIIYKYMFSFFLLEARK